MTSGLWPRAVSVARTKSLPERCTQGPPILGACRKLSGETIASGCIAKKTIGDACRASIRVVDTWRPNWQTSKRRGERSAVNRSNTADTCRSGGNRCSPQLARSFGLASFHRNSELNASIHSGLGSRDSIEAATHKLDFRTVNVVNMSTHRFGGVIVINDRSR